MRLTKDIEKCENIVQVYHPFLIKNVEQLEKKNRRDIANLNTTI